MGKLFGLLVGYVGVGNDLGRFGYVVGVGNFFGFHVGTDFGWLGYVVGVGNFFGFHVAIVCTFESGTLVTDGKDGIAIASSGYVVIGFNTGGCVR